VFGFALSRLARILILYDSCLLPEEFCDKIIHVSFGYKSSQLMLYSEIIAVCSEIHTKHINAFCGQKVEYFEC
jgi:hypothetical protein